MRLFVTSRALLVNSKGEILLVRRSATDPAHPRKWDIPGGRQEPGEDLCAAATRETLEEVGVRLRDPRLVFAISAPRPEGSGTWLFFAEKVPDDTEITLGDEHDRHQWVPFADVPQYTDYSILLRMHEHLTTYDLLEAL